MNNRRGHLDLRRHRDTLLVAVVALLARIGIVIWAANRIPPTADGDFYHVIGTRISQGLGYTWLWPDGVVTYAAHYPVGYPAMLGGLYSVFGDHAWVGMTANAVLGALTAAGCHVLAKSMTTPRWALVAGLSVALHVAHVPYTAALMTEILTGAAWTGAVVLAMVARASPGRKSGWLVLLGLALGAATLVRPQTLILIVPLAWLATEAGSSIRKRIASTVLVAILATLTISPWIIRNHVRMGEAGLSFNGGWNLLIGATPSAHGTFAPLEVPEACREVFDEAKKDICFGRAAREIILADPVTWALGIPKKLASTFNYCGAAGWYLHEAKPSAFPYRAKVVLGTIETLFVRALLLAALVGMGRAPGPRRKARLVLAVLSALVLFTPHGWLGFLGLLLVLLLQGRELDRMPVAVPATAVVLAATVLSHAVFFGGGRYSLVLLPLLATLVGGVVVQARRNDEAQDSTETHRQR